MDIDVTNFVNTADPTNYFASWAEKGELAGTITWNAALRKADEAPMLDTKEKIDTFKRYVKGFGAWSDEEIAAWSNQECEALFIQFVSAAMRENDNGSLFHGENDRVYYYLGD